MRAQGSAGAVELVSCVRSTSTHACGEKRPPKSCRHAKLVLRLTGWCQCCRYLSVNLSFAVVVTVPAPAPTTQPAPSPVAAPVAAPVAEPTAPVAAPTRDSSDSSDDGKQLWVYCCNRVFQVNHVRLEREIKRLSVLFFSQPMVPSSVPTIPMPLKPQA